ncbi:hypothetical protein BDW02DRAFT_626204 [Decorospora gaudefroyi]|uniref:Uncharacterized protein n=1 Tax=Decorospora gaudefroyi TaxID=184978 RepID=A0A6A5KUA4_9PLEO|nr:hypothetical protein BDW02DRAFT_626204 [Decorospora gaudefroyi]
MLSSTLTTAWSYAATATSSANRSRQNHPPLSNRVSPPQDPHPPPHPQLRSSPAGAEPAHHSTRARTPPSPNREHKLSPNPHA